MTFTKMAARQVAALAMDRESTGEQGCRVIARGQIDLSTAPLFKSSLAAVVDEGVTDLEVDLTGVDFLDSAGLGVLVGIDRRLRPLDGTLTVVSPDPTVRRVFQLVRSDMRLRPSAGSGRSDPGPGARA